MALDKRIITQNAEKVMRYMKSGYLYTLNKLQEITDFGATELCLALLLLIQQNKIEQLQDEEGGIRYALC
ncbi:MAG: hypothetical protein IKB31_08365 [Bacteroidaceae bacterium]|jgi:hypothetical protein|nr:hypothetical protein [Bacteroidaceae bacterium]